ncbi:hypothetical protein FRC02_011617 [Tulasnella sp. 418]|nr:hypothetical protein FRC02_011617 [Tulasnella sp. 418]
MPSFITLPDELICNIVEALIHDSPYGLPETVFYSLRATCRRLYHSISMQHESLVLRAQFDTKAILRRLPSRSGLTAFAPELERRWRALKRIRWAGENPAVWGTEYTSELIRNDLWVIFILLLENDGKNWIQLVEWARLRAYIRACLDYDLIPACSSGELPEDTENRSLILWILWIYLITDNTPGAETLLDARLRTILTAINFCPYAYATAHTPWYTFSIRQAVDFSSLTSQIAQPRPLTPIPQYIRLSSMTSYLNDSICISYPLLSEAALRLYSRFISRLPSTPVWTSEVQDSMFSRSIGYDREWFSLTSMWGSLSLDNKPLQGFRPVNRLFSGIYEGMFRVREYELTRRLAGGAVPIPEYEDPDIYFHYQTWNFVVYVFDPQASVNSPGNRSRAMLPGPATNAFLPEDAEFREDDDGVEVYTPQGGTYYYRKLTPNSGNSSPRLLTPVEAESPTGSPQERVNVIVIGESIDPIHAPPTTWNMMPPTSTARGVIRSDGQVILRARAFNWAINRGGDWIYYLRLHADRSLVGRWRGASDNLTGVAHEGSFELHALGV